MLTASAAGRGYQRKSPRFDGRLLNVYVIRHMPGDPEQDE
jgi:putative DNA primase/helicase